MSMRLMRLGRKKARGYPERRMKKTVYFEMEESNSSSRWSRPTTVMLDHSMSGFRWGTDYSPPSNQPKLRSAPANPALTQGCLNCVIDGFKKDKLQGFASAFRDVAQIFLVAGGY